MNFTMLIEQFILSGLFGGQGALLPRHNNARQGFVILSGLLVAGGVAFLTTGLFLWLQLHHETYIAASLTGLALLICGISFYLAHQAFLYFRLKKIADYGKKIGDNALNILEELIQEFEEPIQDNPKTAAFLACLAGYVAAEKTL